MDIIFLISLSEFAIFFNDEAMSAKYSFFCSVNFIIWASDDTAVSTRQRLFSVVEVISMFNLLLSGVAVGIEEGVPSLGKFVIEFSTDCN